MLALFGRPADLSDPDLFAAVDKIEKQVLPGGDATVVHPWTIEDGGRRPDRRDAAKGLTVPTRR